MTTVTFEIDDSAFVDKLGQIDEMVSRAMRKAMLVAEAEAKKSFGQPGKLRSRSGRLRSSIKSNASGLTGYLESNVVYAPTHEYGATILPKRGKYLKFEIAGQWKSVKQVVIPARPFLGPAIKDNIDKIGKVLIDELVKEFK